MSPLDGRSKSLKKRNYLRFMVILLSLIAIVAIFSVAVFTDFVSVNLYAQNEEIINEQKSIAANRHLRGAWISTVVNIDWPSPETKKIADDTERIKKSKSEMIAILDRAVELKLNAVFFQVSPEADAFYKSNIVPWSRYLTGTFGKDPGFDPLQFVIDEAHKRNLELHAWFNPYRVSMGTSDAIKTSLNIDKSVYKQHPEWIKTASNRFVVDPGMPEARQWVCDRVMEVVNNYDVDGVHFDDYFYYEEKFGELNDTETFKKYNSGGFSNIGDWRRNNTYLLVSELSKKIRQTKSWVKFGISPSGVWGNKSELPGGSNTSTTYTNYGTCFADTKKWVEQELIDYIAPQLYYSYATKRAPYGEVSSWWANLCKNKKVHLYIGVALYKVNDDPDENFKGDKAVSEITTQLKSNMETAGIKGSILFTFHDFNDNSKKTVVDSVTNNVWNKNTLIPVMYWKGGAVPKDPENLKAEKVSGGTKLSWTNGDTNTCYFAVYRFLGDITPDNIIKNAACELVTTIRKDGKNDYSFVDKFMQTGRSVFYVVTSLDRLHNESKGSLVIASMSKYFLDVGTDYWWAFEAIDRLYEKEVVNGVGNNKFEPGRNTKRGDFIVMSVRGFKLSCEFSENFKDVPKSSYYYNHIGIAKALGVAKGNGTVFEPEKSITREDIVVLLSRVLSVSGVKLESSDAEYIKSYSDASQISDYAKDEVALFVKHGFIVGTDNKINPKQPATRAEIAVILDRIMNKLNI